MSLEQSVSLKQAIIYGVGVILGAGIYSLIGHAANISGTSLWISFIVAAFLALMTAFSYAELSSRFPRESAEAVYVLKAFGRNDFSFVVGFISLIVMLFSASTVAIGFASYFSYFIPLPLIITSILIIAICSLVNFFGIQQSAKLNTILTFFSAFGLILIIVFGFSYIGSVDLLLDINENPIGFNFFPILFSGVALIFFAYIGFEQIANIAEEIIHPKHNVPLAIILSLLIATILYVLVAIVSVSVVSPKILGAATSGEISSGPLAIVAMTAIGPEFASIISIIALFATSSTILIVLIVASRIIYGLASQGLLPKKLSLCYEGTKTPYFAVLISAILAILFLFIGDLEILGNLTTLGTFLLFFLVNVSLIALRIKEKKIEAIVSSPVNISYYPVLAIIGAIFCLFMFLTQYWQTMNIFSLNIPIIIFGIIIFGISYPLYLFFNNDKKIW